MVIFAALLYLAAAWASVSNPEHRDWWWSRPVWVLVLFVLLLPVALLLSPLERRGPAADATVPSTIRQISGALMICLGVALIAMFGFGGGPIPRLDVIAFSLVIVGSAIGGLLPNFRRDRKKS